MKRPAENSRTQSGRYVRDCDAPRIPAQRITDTGNLLLLERDRLAPVYATVELAYLSLKIRGIQEELISSPRAKTRSQTSTLAEDFASALVEAQTSMFESLMI